jgi:N-methylhydantoinase B
MGDLRAQITAITTGERRFSELVNRYGKDAVLQSISIMMDQSEAVARENTINIPDGTYEAESYMDDDGVDVGQRIPIRVKVIKKGDEMTIDLSDVSNQVRGFYNSGWTTGIACAQVAFKCLTTPTEYPVNDSAALHCGPSRGSCLPLYSWPVAKRWKALHRWHWAAGWRLGCESQ